MSDAFIGQISIFGFGFAPKSWAQCNGQLLSIAQNTALFSLLGTTFGGDGRVTFGLPDLRGRTPLHWGNGAGIDPVVLGEVGGTQTVTIISSEMPMHNHLAQATSVVADKTNPSANIWAAEGGGGATQVYSDTSTGLAPMAPTALGNAGGSQPHTNLQPYLTVNFCICLYGIYPSRN